MSSDTIADLADLVQEWLRIDKNPGTKREISDLWTAGHTAELEKRMRSRIEFGTAGPVAPTSEGLRGRMEAGWSRMNDLTVIQASQGLCAYVLEHVDNPRDRGVVIGYDHRHNSERWARLTAAAFIDRGFKTYLYRGLVHTPMVPFGVKRLSAACGVMITASHNPKHDNGYKVYWENGVQIVSPHDAGISASIATNLDPKRWDADSVLVDPLCIDRTREMTEGYFDHIASLSQHKVLNGSTDVKFVNTSMHGVSHVFVQRGFEHFGFRPFIPVKEQQDPDPEFPSVKFPNPEEAGALDLAVRTAEATGATYVLAQDPDADRFSAAERRVDGTWVMFTGNQLGTLFAARILEQYKASGKPLDKLSMVASAVSSKMIEAMAAAEGFKFTECLTGFKYIGNTALALVEQGFEVPFGYEEAIGFMIGSEIRDKDGVAAAVFFAELVALLHGEGKTASSFLRELYDRYGYFQENNSYFICDNPLIIDRIFARLRNYDGQGSSRTPSYPKSIAGLEVTSVVDLTLGYDSTNPPTYKPSLPTSSGHMIQFRAASKDGVKIVLTTRTSGTEPKIKYYLEGSGQDRDAVQNVLGEVVRELTDEWMQASLNKLGRP